MTDTRTRREKLEAMAGQTVSPNEAAIARRILDEMGPTVSEAAADVYDSQAFRHFYGQTIDQWLNQWEADERERKRQEAQARRLRERAAADHLGPNREMRPRWEYSTRSAHPFAPSMGVRCARCGETKVSQVHR